MKPIVIAILGAAALLLLFSCDRKNENEDLTHSVNKAGSIETAVQVEHLDSARDVLITSHRIWARNEEIKTISYRDTLPSLGTEYTTAEDQDGNPKNVQAKKDYEIFITIK